MKQFIITTFCFSWIAIQSCIGQTKIGKIDNGYTISLQKNINNNYELEIGIGSTKILSSKVIGIEIYQGENAITEYFDGYKTFTKTAKGFIGKAYIKINKNCGFEVTDSVTLNINTISFARSVVVNGKFDGGFLSSIELKTDKKFDRNQVDVFVPGMIYGGTSHLTSSAIGGENLYKTTNGKLWIREDRMPAPLLGIRSKDSAAMTVFIPNPDGNSDTLDTKQYGLKTLINKNVSVGALGLNNQDNFFAIGYRFPGSEGEYTFKENTYPDGQLHNWRRRYHPIENGFKQEYKVDFMFSKENTFPDFYSHTWRWAWNRLNPKVNYQDIELVRVSISNMLVERVETKNGLSGITNWTIAAKDERHDIDRKSIMGFTGKTLESASFLLQEADRYADKNKYRQPALAIFDSFIKLKMNPPVSEGFNLDTGEPEIAIPHDKKIYLRSFGDDMKATLKAYIREKSQGNIHEDWLQWVKSFTDWLLTQQLSTGGFPRSWKPKSGEIRDSSAQSSFSAIPLLVLMNKITKDSKYKDAAIKTGEFIWNNGQREGIFVGGTIDNPDVIDKEAGTLSLEAYLSLLELTGDKKWLLRAKMAANFAETWIYVWNVPMPFNADDKQLPWKKGVPTVGLQLISTGHSLADAYMAFDVDEYAQMYKLTNDQHYLDVARLLLHNTKSMMALSNRPYDLRGPGWMQEHWSLAPQRGYGIHRGWLPWVSTSQLNGIIGLEELDKKLYKKLIRPETNK